jgi:hypothetical protein
MKGYYEIKNKFYFPLSIRVFAGLIMCILLFAVFNDHPEALYIYPLGFYFMLCRGGTQIDFEKKRIRDYQNFFGLKIALWEELPEIEYIALHKVTELYGVQSVKAGYFDTHSEQKFRVNLVSHKKEIIMLYDSDEREPAFNLAKKISEITGLNVFITDGLGKPRWLNKK